MRTFQNTHTRTNPPSEQEELLQRTWQALQEMPLDSKDSRNVNRFEKLSKLWLTLEKQVRKADKEKPDEEIVI